MYWSKYAFYNEPVNAGHMYKLMKYCTCTHLTVDILYFFSKPNYFTIKRMPKVLC